MHVYSCSIAWVVARSPSDAAEVFYEEKRYDADEEWHQAQDGLRLAIRFPDEGVVSKTCGEWAAEKGRCYLASGNI